MTVGWFRALRPEALQAVQWNGEPDEEEAFRALGVKILVRHSASRITVTTSIGPVDLSPGDWLTLSPTGRIDYWTARTFAAKFAPCPPPCYDSPATTGPS